MLTFEPNFSIDGENGETTTITELRNAQVIPSPAPTVKRTRGRPRRQPTPATTNPENDVCENTPPNSVGSKRRNESDGESQPASDNEAKRQRSEDDDELQMKYQQYWDKHCPALLTSTAKLVEPPPKQTRAGRSDEQR